MFLDCGRATRLRVCHSVKQEEFVDWLHKELQPFSVKKWYGQRERNGKIHEYVYFNTAVNNEFQKVKSHFYFDQTNGGKILRPSIWEHLTPLSLAVWYMSDGSIHQVSKNGYDVRIALHKTYTGWMRAMVVRELKKRWDIDTSLYNKNDNCCNLYIKANSRIKFLKMIEPYILPCFDYKMKCLGSNVRGSNRVKI